MSDKNRQLHISKADLFDLIKQYIHAEDINPCIKSEVLMNRSSSQTRYKFENDDILFEIDIYYRKDNTITLMPFGNKESVDHCNKLIDIVYESLEFKEVCKKTFVCLINDMDFNMLITYLGGLPGVSCELDSDKGSNGRVLKYVSEIGDNINLTYWQSKSKLMFQGCVMRLCAEIECFLAALSIKSEYVAEAGKQPIDPNVIEKIVKKQFPSSYEKLHELFKDLLFDSFSLCIQQPTLRDYGVVSFPALKALEGRIKQIFKNNQIQTDTEFSINRSPLFITNVNGEYILDTSLVSISDVYTINILGSCYDYYHKFRHTLFHTRSSLNSTTRILSIAFAEEIINHVCELIENSYNVLGQ